MENPIYKYSHILIIDDNKMDVAILKEVITSLNFGEYISCFENSVSAYNYLRRYKQNMPDVIFVDLNMRGIGGFQFIERFEQEFSHPTKFIIVTSSDDPSDIEASSMYRNVIHYFIKPINKIDLSYME